MLGFEFYDEMGGAQRINCLLKDRKRYFKNKSKLQEIIN